MTRSIPRPLRRLCRLAALLAAPGCTWPVPLSAAAAPPGRWEKLRAQDLRVAGVAYRLSLANRRLCPRALASQPGFVLHSIEQYDAADRQEAAHSFGLGSNVGVMAVVAGSPAQRSGLAADDQLVSVNGRVLSGARVATNAGPTRARVEFAQRILADAMAKGEVILLVSRAGGLHEVRFTADTGCASVVELVTAAEVNAWADGQRVLVSDSLVAHCASDGDLALVIGHELAHNFLHHSQRLAVGARASRGLRLTGTGSAEMREAEEAADRLGVRLASAAAYDLSDSLSFVTALLDADGAGRAAGTHPAPARRLALLRAEIAAAGAKAASVPEGSPNGWREAALAPLR